MGPTRKILRIGPLLFLFLPCALQGQRGGDAEGAYLRAVAEYFNIPHGEAVVLSQWGLAPAELPVVLFLSGRAGVSPDVVISQRQRNRGWLDIAQRFSVHAGDFYVRIDGATGSLAPAYARFAAGSASEWHLVELSDIEVVTLVNVRFLSRHLDLPARRVIQTLDEAGEAPEAFQRLRRNS